METLGEPMHSSVTNGRSSDWRRAERIEAVLRWMRSCAVCTSMLPPIDLLCEECWERLARLRNGSSRLLSQAGYAVPVFALFTWTPQTEPILKPFIHAFKKGRSPRAAARVAEWFATERLKEKWGRRSLVPAPAPRFDHAKVWAEALGALVNAPIMDVLQGDGHSIRPQRSRNKEERAELRFRVKTPSETAQNAYRGPWVFVDDVITTGSTAMAAFMALGDPSEFEVWAIVNRPRLATK